MLANGGWDLNETATELTATIIYNINEETSYGLYLNCINWPSPFLIHLFPLLLLTSFVLSYFSLCAVISSYLIFLIFIPPLVTHFVIVTVLLPPFVPFFLIFLPSFIYVFSHSLSIFFPSTLNYSLPTISVSSIIFFTFLN